MAPSHLNSRQNPLQYRLKPARFNKTQCLLPMCRTSGKMIGIIRIAHTTSHAIGRPRLSVYPIPSRFGTISAGSLGL